jgi:hypothetical protein
MAFSAPIDVIDIRGHGRVHHCPQQLSQDGGLWVQLADYFHNIRCTHTCKHLAYNVSRPYLLYRSSSIRRTERMILIVSDIVIAIHYRSYASAHPQHSTSHRIPLCAHFPLLSAPISPFQKLGLFPLLHLVHYPLGPLYTSRPGCFARDHV